MFRRLFLTAALPGSPAGKEMTRRLRGCLLALLLGSVAGADRLTFGAWSFALDDEPRVAVENGVRAYTVPGATYLFTPPEPLAGRTLEAVATATIADLTRGQASNVKFVRRQAVDGGVLLAYSGPVTNPAAGTGGVQTYFFYEKEGQWGLALLMAGPGADHAEVLEPLGTVSFNPSSLTVRTEPPPRLPPVPWSTPRPDRTASTRAGLDFPTARRRGLDPEQDLLPGGYDCYFVGESGGDDLRAMTPTPDLRLGVSAGGTYTSTDGVTRAQGGWAQTRPAADRHRLTLTGPLVARDTRVDGDDHGQGFLASHAASGRKVACYQAGPRAEGVRLELTRKRIGSEPLTCRDARGGQPYPLTFGAGTYRTPRGDGRARTVFSGGGLDQWRGLVEFGGGPLDLLVGEMNEDGDGNRELRVTEKTTTHKGAFYRETSVTLITTCRARVQAKPTPLYGPAPAPRTGLRGGPSGLFVSNQYVVGFNGNFPTNHHEVQLSLFRPDGYFLDDLDPTDLGTVPDCGRTRPNGDPFCDRYEIGAGTLRTQDRDGDWNKPDAFQTVGGGFRIGDTVYHPLTPLTRRALAGVYGTHTETASGPSLGILGGGVGVYTSLSSGYLFTAEGEVQWKSDSSGSTLISPNQITGGGVTGGGSSSRRDGGQGRYTLKDHWLTLTLGDGRVRRLFVYAQPGGILRADPTLGDRVNIGGTWLKRVGGR